MPFALRTWVGPRKDLAQIAYFVNTLRGKNGLHAFRNNSARSESIWIKSGTVWAKCGDGWPWQILCAIRSVATVWEGSFKKTHKLLTKVSSLAISGRHNSAMITDPGNSWPNTPSTECLVSILTVRINSSLSHGLYAAHQKGTYPNVWQSLTVTVHVLLSHDAKVNKPMWAWQLCDVASVNNVFTLVF